MLHLFKRKGRKKKREVLIPVEESSADFSGYEVSGSGCVKIGSMTLNIPSPWIMVGRYKMSVIQMYNMERSRTFFSGDHRSEAALYTEPVIIQRDELPFPPVTEVCVDHFFGDLLNPLAVILQGSSGSGKSSIAQKIMLDWASGKYPEKFNLVFYLKCEKLMCFSEEMSLIDLLSWSCSLTSNEISEMLQESKVLFIIDGFEELRFTQDIFYTPPPTDLHQKVPPEVSVCALLKGQILPDSFLLVTTRSSATQSLNNLINRPQCFTNTIVGFSKKKIEEYFQKFFQDEVLFRKAYESVGSNETMLTACSIPVICWVICTVIRERFNDGADITTDLETTTSIYVEFVSTLLEHHGQGLNESVPNLLRSLGQLAERGMLEQQVLFDEKNIQETVQDPVNNPFLNKFLLERRIKQETMFRFIHLSFQKLFTALYFVLLDEDESQKKVRELLHTVERGWALSSWSAAEFSNRDSEIRKSNQLQSVILFLCGLCKNETIDSFFKKHNVTVSINIETQLKEWIHQCSLRYQHENMMFILHCLYELHERSFIGKVLGDLVLIDLSNISLHKTDCWVLRFCFQCCERIRNLRLNVTSDHLKILQPALCSCEELRLIFDHILDDVGDFILALGDRKLMNQLMIKVDKNKNRSCPEIIGSVKDGVVTLSVSCSKISIFRPIPLDLTLICPRPVICTINWRDILQTFMRCTKEPEGSDKEVVALLQVLRSSSGLKKIHLQVDILSDTLVHTIISLIQTCPSLREFGIKAILTLQQEVIQTLQESLTDMDWMLNIWRKSLLLTRDKDSTEEELKTEYMEEALVSVSSSTLQAPGPTTSMFTPELTDRDEVKGENTHRFFSPHGGQFQCSLTKLVFVMEGKGEMLYKIVPWDPRLLDGLGQMQPAGPLYNIDCFEGSISQLHLPHCEIFSGENKVSLAVAHITGDNVEVLQPLKKEKILDVHLLPRNVPVSEVKIQHKENRHIQTSSKCRLTPGREYSLCCLPEGLKVQPENELFEFDFDPNFHPTFEVILDVNIEEIKLSLLDKTDEEKIVWTPRQIFFTESGSSTDSTAIIKDTESEFVDNNRDELIQRVTSVMEIADCLRSKKMITDEMWSEVHAENTHRKQMRILYMVLISGGSVVKAEFYKLLKEKEPHLVESLESSSSTSPQ
ncbi:NACHT, LRR and PYD domains-containing protein 1 homolog isoform X2 [Paramisgurnus dabryanus]|uniref:NACHT, LRR and PYD domains-containing protein 1 homolog isoform X2 n=1 Tax=Paramisgurnus dabryanus TaxID=90735 RepID=UPI0031F4076C